MKAVSTGAEQVAGLLREAERAVVLTGAGISVPSGIPDFRSPGTGLWENVDPMEVAHIDAWRRDPDRFWSFYGQRFASLVDKAPNDAHLAVAELERRGVVRAVITQNIDRLHRLAGTERLIEVHGSIDQSVCMQCGGKVSIDRVVELLGARRRRAAVRGLRGAAEARRGPLRRAAPRAGAGRGAAARDGRRPDDLRGLLARGLPGGRTARDHPRRRRPPRASHAGPDAL